MGAMADFLSFFLAGGAIGGWLTALVMILAYWCYKDHGDD